MAARRVEAPIEDGWLPTSLLQSYDVAGSFWALGRTTRMKKSVAIILIVAFNLFAIANIVHDFVTSDGVHYFSDQPHRLLLVAIIGVVGGLVAFGFSALSPQLQRGVKLSVLGLGGSFVLLAGGYFSFQVASLPARIDPTFPRHVPWLLALGTVAIAGLLWFEFFQILRRHDHVA